MDSGLLAIVALGFFLGMRHATDPDHVIAVTTIVARQRGAVGAALIGAVWGVGHTLTIVVVGSGIILFNWAIPPRIGLAMEFAVGLMLILLGALNLRGFARALRGEADAAHVHAHSHGDYVHTHGHGHGHEPEAHPHAPDQTPLGRMDRWLGAAGWYRLVRPLVVGVVHGLAGSAAVALLVLTTIRNPKWSVLYLLLFGLGTVVGMAVITTAIAWPFARARRRPTRLGPGLRIASGLVSLAFGCFLAYRIGVVDGLFGAHPLWTPQ